MAKVIIIHGTTGSPDENWYPWLKRELLSRGHSVLVPRFPTPQGQSLAAWKEAFYNQVASLDSQMVLVGHSLGAGFILTLLEESSIPILATFFICGFLGKLGLPEFDILNESFVCRDFDWRKISLNCGDCFVVNSDNDPYVHLSKGEELAQKLKVPLTVLSGAKHINEAAGYTSFPFILQKIEACLLNAVK